MTIEEVDRLLAEVRLKYQYSSAPLIAASVETWKGYFTRRPQPFPIPYPGDVKYGKRPDSHRGDRGGVYSHLVLRMPGQQAELLAGLLKVLAPCVCRYPLAARPLVFYHRSLLPGQVGELVVYIGTR